MYYSPAAESGIKGSMATITLTGVDKEEYLTVKEVADNSTFSLSFDIKKA